MAEDVRSWKQVLLVIAFFSQVILHCDSQDTTASLEQTAFSSSPATTSTTREITTTPVNRPPQWRRTLQDTLQRGLSEGLSPNKQLGFIEAVDPENEQVTYSVISDILSVNRLTGEVTLTRLLDRESSAQLNVTFIARDTSSNQNSLTISVPVLDINDNKPVFKNLPSSVTVSEASEVNSLVYSGIEITDLDAGVNSQIQITCISSDSESEETCATFAVTVGQRIGSTHNASLMLKKAVDYETKKEYKLVLRVQDNGQPPLNGTGEMMIQISDAQDMKPKLINPPVALVVPENANQERVLASFQAQDQDLGNPRAVVFSVVNDGERMFRFTNAVRGDGGVYTASLTAGPGGIDREKHPETFNIIVRANEVEKGEPVEGAYVDTTVAVTIEDLNDNAPSFNSDSYTVSLPETGVVGSFVPGLNMMVTDNDRGSNSKYQLSVITDNFGTFTVVPSVGSGSTVVSLQVKSVNAMDYENPNYRTQVIKVRAVEYETSEQRSSTATVTVRLTDMNDNYPFFPPPSSVRSYTVSENDSVGKLIATITAQDSDSGTYGKLNYSIHGSKSVDKFRVVNPSGELRLAKKLDYETEPLIEFMYTATDGGGLTKSIRVKLLVSDYNDQGPKFARDSYMTYVQEGSLTLQPALTISAVDPEKSDSISYRIVKGNPAGDAFLIDRSSGVLSLSRGVGFQETPERQGYFELTVEASDNDNPPQSSQVSVSVHVQDINDHDPVFSSRTYTGQVTEITAPGTSVLKVNATDSDDGPNKEINYIIHTGSRDNFIINTYTGSVQVASGANLDRDIYGSRYSMVVHAVDKGSPPRTGTAEIVITVTDSNNKPPVFSQKNYFVSLPENSSKGTTVIDLLASDPDNGSVLEYSLQQDSISAKDKNGKSLTSLAPFNYKLAFGIDRTSGVVRTLTELSRELAAEISFVAEVRDIKAQQPVLQTATASVIVTISGVDQNKLVFTSPWTPTNPSIVISIPEEEKVGSLVTTLVAKDPVTNEPVQQMKKIADSDPAVFRLDEKSGKVYLRRRLDYETLPSKTLSFQVEAFTDGPPRKTGINTVYVQVQDINDHSPSFVQNTYDFRVMESAKYPTQIGIVVATDADAGTNGAVRYTISGQDSNLFSMEATTGALSVAENTDLDRETKPQYKFIVVATDNTQSAGMKRSTSVPLNIEVGDENDNSPKFTRTQYVFQKLETDTNPRVGQVFATDADSGLNGMILYSIQSGGEGLFKIDSVNGVIETRGSLQGRARGNPYVLKVAATDRTGAGQVTTQDVNIFINNLQVNDGRPRFIYPGRDEQEVLIKEESAPGSPVYQVKAQDADAASSGGLIYGFVSTDSLRTDHDKFVINPQTGEITTAVVLDREEQQVYQLTLLVKDKGTNPHEVTRRLIVKLEDINDNKPTFNCPSFQTTEPLVLYVPEEEPAGVKVGQIQACDKDAGDNAKLYFYIMCGNEAVDSNGTRPFTIDKSTGALFTAMTFDREQKPNYDICITVSNSPNLTVPEDIKEEANSSSGEVRVKRSGHMDDLGVTLKVKVYVEDVDDHGPTFDYQKDSVFSAGVSVVAPIFTEVMRVTARDLDVGLNSDVKHAILSCVYVDEEDVQRNTTSAFTIDQLSGVVKTNRKHYLDYLNGHFKISVTATDTKMRTGSAQLYVYTIRDSDRLKFIWDNSLQVVLSKQKEFIRQLSSLLPGYQFTVQDPYYHVMSDGSVDDDRIDLCFYMVKDHKVLSVSQGLALFSSVTSTTKQLFRQFDVEDVGACTVKYTTELWAGYTYLWWILVAVAVLIFIIVLVMVIIICCIWFRYKKLMGASKPYVVLDPVGIKNDNYEWQENTIRM